MFGPYFVLYEILFLVSLLGLQSSSWPRGYKTFFILNSTDHELILLINVRMPTIYGILTSISMIDTAIGGL